MPPLTTQQLLAEAWDTDVVHMNLVAGCFHELLGERRIAMAHAGSILCCVCVAAPITILANLATGAMPWYLAFIPLWLVAALTLCVVPTKWVFADNTEGKAAYTGGMLCGVLPLLATLVLLSVRLDGNSSGDALPMYWVLFPLFLVHGCGMVGILCAAVGTCISERNDSSIKKVVLQVSGATCAACCLMAPITATYIMTSLIADDVTPNLSYVYAFLPGGILLLCGAVFLAVATGAELRSRRDNWQQEAEECRQRELNAKRPAQGLHGPLLLAPDALAVAPVQTTHYMLQPSRTASPSDSASRQQLSTAVAPLLSDAGLGAGVWSTNSFAGRMHHSLKV